jgi:hypothetical protein
MAKPAGFSVFAVHFMAEKTLDFVGCNDSLDRLREATHFFSVSFVGDKILMVSSKINLSSRVASKSSCSFIS